MPKQSPLSFTDRDIIQDNTVTELARRAYNIFAPHYDLLGLVLQDFQLESAPIRTACSNIIEHGLTQEGFQALHRTLSEDALAGVWRGFVVEAGEWQFVLPEAIQEEMAPLFGEEYNSVGKCLIFLMESLERIHPFADRNRRVCSITMNMLLLRAHLMPIPWNKSRKMWEDPLLAPFTEESKKRYLSLMQTIEKFYLQKIPD